jgi:hypothetical protein
LSDGKSVERGESKGREGGIREKGETETRPSQKEAKEQRR